MRNFFVGLFCLASLVLVAEVAREFYFLFKANSPDPSYKIIVVEPGPFHKTAEFLQEQGLISDARRLTLLARIMRVSGNVKVGEYEVRMDMTPIQLLKVITSGKSVLHAIHIPEGYNIEQIADELAAQKLVIKKDFISMAKDPHMAKYVRIDDNGLEGYLYPETYSFTRFTGERTIIKTMVEKFKEVYNREVRFAAEKQGRTIHDVVTLASIVEKETGVPEERPLIASVFFNRLKLNMPLQSDPTVIYGKKGDKSNITKKDLLTPNPYNTYTKRGLPIGPIANPGSASLLAVIEPADSKYLYFVSKNDGTHVFSGNYADHLKAVSKYQLDPEARRGKSWRDRLKKNPKDQSIQK